VAHRLGQVQPSVQPPVSLRRVSYG
jgi:hypothetical protein